MIVPPFDHDWIIAGQGTLGLEILEQVPDLAAVLVPVGGGGLIAGVAAAVKHSAPSVRVIGVEPLGSASMKASLDAGRPVMLERTHSIADGLLALRPGDRTFAHVRAFVDDIVTVEDSAIVETMYWLHSAARVVAEPSGAVATAAALLRSAVYAPNGGPIVAVVSGGNVAPDLFAGMTGRPSLSTDVC